MKIKYKHKGLTSTNKMVFENFCVVDVSEEVGKTLLKQPHLFEEIVEQKIVKTVEQTEKIEETKTETQVEKPTKNSTKTKSETK